MAILDSYSESNQSSTGSAVTTFQTGQSFTASATENLTGITVHIAKLASAEGSVTIDLYAHTGTYGTSSLPTGSPLATSDSIDASLFTTSLVLATFIFSGVNQYSLTNGTNYVFVVKKPSGALQVNLGRDTTSPSHGGNYVRTIDGGANWIVESGIDLCFYVYGTPSSITGIQSITGLSSITF